MKVEKMSSNSRDVELIEILFCFKDERNNACCVLLEVSW